MRPPRVPRRPGGVTLIELVVAVAIVAMLAALAVPAMHQWMMAQRVKGVASELLTDIRFMRSEGVTRNRGMQISFQSDASQTCYTIQTSTDGSSCNCLDAQPCLGINGVSAVKTTSVPKGNGVVLSWNIASGIFLGADNFKAQPALAITVTGLPNQTLQVVVTSSTRRPSICTPAESTIKGYPQCT